MIADQIIDKIEERIRRAAARYGDFASAHEALGVALEEWDEFRDAVRGNDPASIEHEALDLAAVLIRIARNMRDFEHTRIRSSK